MGSPPWSPPYRLGGCGGAIPPAPRWRLAHRTVMVKMSSAVLLALLGGSAAVAAGADVPIWPRPASASIGIGVRELHGLTFTVTPAGDSPDLQAAIGRYTALMLPHGAAEPGAATSVSVAVLRVAREMTQTTDESYTLGIPASGGAITIRANTTIGAYRALETLSQLVEFNFSASAYAIRGVPWAIADRPRFPWRGLMVDTSRHWLPVASILRTLDGLAYSKMNVLHWHIVDRESFPLQLDSAPRLALGSWTPAERYSTSDVRRIVEYARVRGVRVVPEIDLPTHTASWCVGMPELCPHAPVIWNQSSGKGSGRFDCGPCSPW